MRWFRLMGTTAVAGIASMGLVATTAAAGALAATAPTAGVGQFTTWRAAQRAAGFGLMKPTNTYGAHRAGKIMVTRCEEHLRSRYRIVTTNYGSSAFHYMVLSQNNSGGACQSEGNSHLIRRVRVQGVTAMLRGLCGMAKLPRCTNNRKVWLFLIWRKHGVYYIAASYGEWQNTLIGFGRHLVPVR